MKLIFSFGPKPILKKLDENNPGHQDLLVDLLDKKTVDIQTVVFNQTHFAKEWVIIKDGYRLVFIGIISNISSTGRVTTARFKPQSKVFVWSWYVDKKSRG